MLVLAAIPGRSSVSQCLWTAQQRAGAQFRPWDEEISADCRATIWMRRTSGDQGVKRRPVAAL
jgi:hypothetical protein